MKVGLITTIGMNIGDEFIRDGIIHCFEKALIGVHHYTMIHKHDSYQFFPAEKKILTLLGTMRHVNSLANLVGKISGHRKWLKTEFDPVELIIQCGAPIFWPGNGNAGSWEHILWYEVLHRFKGKKRILNVAGGSCYPWEDRDRVISYIDSHSSDRKYIQDILGIADLTTTRDKLAQSICTHVNKATPLIIPCSALLAPRRYKVKMGSENKFIFINYMKNAGHFKFGKEINSETWDHQLKSLVTKFLELKESVVFICHNKEEYDSALRLNIQGVSVVLPKNRQQYFNISRNAKIGICNRQHACIVLAGMGIPSIDVSTDTRMLMVEETGLPLVYVNDVKTELLIDKSYELMKHNEDWKDRLIELSNRTEKKYTEFFKETLG